MTQVPKRRLSLFSFGSSSNSNANSTASGSTGHTSVSPPGSSSGFGFGKGKTLSAMSPTNLSRRNTASNVSTTGMNEHGGPTGTNEGNNITSESASNNVDKGQGGIGKGADTTRAVGTRNNVAARSPSPNNTGHSCSGKPEKLGVNTTPSLSGPPPPPSSSTTMSPSNRKNSMNSDQLNSPISSNSMLENDLNIFERSVQDYDGLPSYPTGLQEGSRRPTLSKLRTKSGPNSSISLSNFKHEDYIPPALDATTSILNDSNTNLDDVDIIYCSRRNSSVLGLNMALGRSTPSRKNSVYSMSQLNHQFSPNPNGNSNPNNTTSASASFNPNNNCNCTNNSVNNINGTSCGGPIPEISPLDSSYNGSNRRSSSNLSPVPMSQPLSQSQSQSTSHPMSPTSPPKLTSSKSSISFYSYADMINNDEYAKRPSFKNSYSHGFVPTRKDSAHSISTKSPSHFNSSNSKKYNSNLNRFLISPESSDLEAEMMVPAKPKSINDRSINDDESLVSSSVGNCLRQTRTEISN